MVFLSMTSLLGATTLVMPNWIRENICGNRPTAPPLATTAELVPEVGVDDIEIGRWGGRGGAAEGDDIGGGEGDDEAAPTAGVGVPNPAIMNVNWRWGKNSEWHPERNSKKEIEREKERKRDRERGVTCRCASKTRISWFHGHESRMSFPLRKLLSHDWYKPRSFAAISDSLHYKIRNIHS